MKTILVSGASGIVGYGILRSLRMSRQQIRLIGTTIYNDSIAQGFCDIFELAPPTNDRGYIDWLLDVIQRYDIDLIIPGIEVDMHKWAESISFLERSSSRVLLNNIKLISLVKDKWVFYEELRRLGVPWAIETTLIPDYDFLVKKFGLPFLLKPREGYGSKGIATIDNKDVFLQYKEDVGRKLMVQPIIGNVNEEYTVSAFCDGKGEVCASMTLRRKLSRDGFTEKAEVASLVGVDEVLSVLSKSFKPLGPTNFQFRVHNGSLKLLEINPRISSATSIRAAFGYNESLMAVKYYLENIRPKQPVVKKGRAVRYFEDFIFYETGTDS